MKLYWVSSKKFLKLAGKFWLRWKSVLYSIIFLAIVAVYSSKFTELLLKDKISKQLLAQFSTCDTIKKTEQLKTLSEARQEVKLAYDNTEKLIGLLEEKLEKTNDPTEQSKLKYLLYEPRRKMEWINEDLNDVGVEMVNVNQCLLLDSRHILDFKEMKNYYQDLNNPNQPTSLPKI